MKRLLSAAAVLMLAALALTGCAAGPPPTSWVSSSSTSVTYLSWTDAKGELSGTAQVTEGHPVAASEATIQGSPQQLTGTESNGKISLRVGGSILGSSITGTISGSELVLDVTTDGGVQSMTFKPGDAKSYNKAVQTLTASVQDQVQKAANAAAVEEIAGLPSLTSAVESAVASVNAAVTAAQTVGLEQGALSVKAGATGCSTSQASKDAFDAAAKTTDALQTLQSALPGLASADSDLQASVGKTSGAQLPSSEQKILDGVGTTLAKGLSLEQSAQEASDRISKASTEWSGQIYHLPWC